MTPHLDKQTRNLAESTDIYSLCKASFAFLASLRFVIFSPLNSKNTPVTLATTNFHSTLSCATVHKENVSLAFCFQDEVAEWLRRWPAKPVGSARVGSNPILVDARARACVLPSTRPPCEDEGHVYLAKLNWRERGTFRLMHRAPYASP
jgi:hypothetical protein